MKKIIFISVLAVLVFSGAGCVKVKVAGFDGGVFKSSDKGLHWEQKVSLLSVGQPRNIAGVSVNNLVFDAPDSNTLYLGSKEDGLFVSYNGAQSWQETEKLSRGMINAVAIDPKTKSIIYVAMGGKIFKSTDCCHNWQNIYLEAAPSVEVVSLAVDPINTSKILAGLSDGRLVASGNSGISWVKIAEHKAKIKQILINRINSDIVYVALAGRGLWRSADGGLNWQSLDDGLTKYPGGRDVELMISNPSLPDSLLTLSSYGLLRTDDGGQTWSDYKLLNSPQKTKIYAVAVNPQNPQEIYYATATTFYRSFDNGNHWETKSLPSKRRPTILLLDPKDQNVIYLGTVKVEK